MNFSAASIKNPLVAILLFTLLTIGGIIGFQKMKIQQFPDVTFPAIVITIPLPGADPAQLENDVATKVENKIASLQGLKHINTTIQSGAATMVAEFVLEKDTQEALDEIRTAVGEVRGELPAAARDPIISKVNISDSPTLIYTIESTKMNELDLSWFVSDTVDKRLSIIKEVGSISRIGGLTRIVKIEANPDRMSALQMPIGNLSNQISYLQKDASGGQAEIGQRIQTIRVLGSVSNAKELNDLQIALPTGGSESLSSLATVVDGASKQQSIAKLDGNTVIAFSVKRTLGASDIDMALSVDKALAKLQEEMPDIKTTKILDRATPIEENYDASIKMLVEGGILAVIVVFIFLKNFRATIVTAVALPLSVIPSFLAMWAFGFSLNIISLLALSLVIGVLVDDAIVEVENIVRHLRMGKTPYQAAMEAADEIGLAVVATTFTLIAVFLPTAFMGGIPGKFFKQFGWTASIAIFISLLVARLITPMMAAYILKPEKAIQEKDGKIMTVYLAVVKWTLNYRLLTLSGVAVFFALSLSVIGLLPKGFIPSDDSNQSRVSIELSPDATLAETTRISEMARMAIKDIEGIEYIMSSIGQPQSEQTDSNSGTGKAVNTASLDLVLVPRAERVKKSELEKEITDALENVPSARFTVGIATGGGNGYTFRLTSSNTLLLEETVTRVMAEIRQLENINDVINNRSLSTPEITVIPNRLAMADRGVTTQAVANTLRVATIGDYSQLLSKLNLDSRQIPIVVQMPEYTRANINELKNLYVPSNGMASTKISDIAELKFSNGPSEIRRYDRARSISITVLSSNSEIGDLVKKTTALSSLPSDITMSERGEAENQTELFAGFLMAMAVGVFCILGVLILLFNKILQPLTILMALPLSIGGAFLGLWLTDSSLSMPSMIGFIMLMGIATKNSILLVDYAIIAERQGLSRVQAILDSCHKRARPIVMTTIAMGAGMLPLVLGLGDVDNSFRRPMAASVLGGLVTSTFLSLVVIPVVYSLMEGLSQNIKKMFSRT